MTETTWAWPEAWDDPIFDSPVYQDRHPTRYVWRPDVEEWARYLVDKFDGVVWCNTYYDHPEGRGFEVWDGAWYIMNTSFDVWGPGGRNDPLGSTVGWQIFGLLMNDPNPPNIHWIIYFGQQYGAWNNWEGEWFADPGDFMYHGDHIHVTYW